MRGLKKLKEILTLNQIWILMLKNKKLKQFLNDLKQNKFRKI